LYAPEALSNAEMSTLAYSTTKTMNMYYINVKKLSLIYTLLPTVQ